ncbi:MAG: hypothetical protein IJF03_00155 [Lachnospiraceae bacterium]|nr:hypothetical protein [Lachnospiraceae bacterium]
MKKCIVAFCAIIMILSSCTLQENATTDNLYGELRLGESSLYEDLSPLPQEIQDIIYNNATFFDVESQKQYTKESYKVTDNEELNQQLQWSEYMVFDFDDDGEKELVVMLDVGGGDPFVRVFDKQEDMVYAYPFVYRGFLHVYEDGGIYGASAADQFMIYKVKFDKNKQEETIILDKTSEETKSGQFEKVWYVKGKRVTEEEFNKFLDEYWDRDKNSDIPWNYSGIDNQLWQMELAKIPVQKKDKVVYNIDVTGDGTEDTIIVDSSKTKRLWNKKVVISVEESDGNEIWREEMEVSEKDIAYYLCKENEKYYLLRYIPEFIEGRGNYSFEVFNLNEKGEELVYSDNITFKTYVEEKYDRNFSSSDMSCFRDNLNRYLSNGILLLGIEDGEVKYSTETKAFTYQEDYKKIIPSDIQKTDEYVNNQLDLMEERILEEGKIDNYYMR